VVNFYDELSTNAMVKERENRLQEEARIASITRELRRNRTEMRRLREAVGLQIVYLGQRISGRSVREIAPRQTAGPSLT
jgi:hypothetical protein